MKHHLATPVRAIAACALSLAIAGCSDAPVDAGARAAEAYIWGYPLVVSLRTIQTLAALLPTNTLTWQQALSGITSRVIVAPNQDTLYAVAPMDLRGEPYALTLPEIRDRYYAFQMIGAYTDAFAYVGTRATGSRAGTWLITPPGWSGELPPGVEEGEQTIVAATQSQVGSVNGWRVNTRVGRYGEDELLRAVVAKVGWGANVSEEALYAVSRQDADGEPYTGARRYVLHFPGGGLPPVDAFWSLTLYGPDMFFTANPIDRYAIGDRTPGLATNPDGSLDLYIQHESPGDRQDNWLPAPEGEFVLMLRLYLPRAEAILGGYEYPPVRPVL